MSPSEINALLPQMNPTEIFSTVKKQLALIATIAAFLPPFERKSSLIIIPQLSIFLILFINYNFWR